MRAASFTSWLKAGAMKSANWISATGRRPLIAAPIEAPTIIDSVNGVSMTRSSPNSAQRPSVARKTPPFLPTSSPRTITLSSRVISSRSPSRIASMNVFRGIEPSVPHAPRRRGLARPALGEDPLHRAGRLRVRLGLGVVGRVVDVGLDRGDDPFLGLGRQDAGVDELLAEDRHGIVRPLGRELLLAAVLRLLVVA